MTSIYIISGLGITILIILVIFYFRHLVPLRRKENGFKYVFIEDDGTVRELDEDEKRYLSEHFLPNDGARPNIKTRYADKTPDGKLRGYILRRMVPKHITIVTRKASYDNSTSPKPP